MNLHDLLPPFPPYMWITQTHGCPRVCGRGPASHHPCSRIFLLARQTYYCVCPQCNDAPANRRNYHYFASAHGELTCEPCSRGHHPVPPT